MNYLGSIGNFHKKSNLKYGVRINLSQLRGFMLNGISPLLY